MYIYTITTQDAYNDCPSFNVVYASENLEALREKLKTGVQAYIENVGYTDDDFIERGLTPLDQTDDFWADEDEDTGEWVEYHIFEVPVI